MTDDKAFPDKAGNKAARPKAQYVYVVLYCWDYEGCELQAVYRRKKDADKHPLGGDNKRVFRQRVRNGR